MYAENNTDNEIYLALSDTLINGFSMKLSNNGQSIPSHAKYLASPNFDLIIDTEDLDSYGIDSIETLTSTLCIKTSMLGNIVAEVPVDISSTEPGTDNSTEVQEDITEATSSEGEVDVEETVIEGESTESTHVEDTNTDFTEIKKGDNNESVVEVQQILISVCSLSNFFQLDKTALAEACSNELKQHHL